jgi:CubicO group peptidase (beta-lactamase class C family)
MKLRITLGLATLLLAACSTTPSQPPVATLARAASPADAGMSAERLARLTARMNQGAASGEFPGAVLMIGRQGKVVYQETFGLRDPATQAPMTSDAIFRIASMSKPITSLAIMMLAEEGKLFVSDPVAKHLPEFKDIKLGVVKKGADGKDGVTLEPPAQTMTIQDLLRHTSGLTYGAAGRNPIKQAYVDAKVGDRNDTNATLITKLSKLPLVYSPGTTWEYSVSTDVLGRIVEVVSGQSLDRFVADRITSPLKMHDTGFAAPTTQAARGARPHAEGPAKRVPDIPVVTADLPYKSGGGGMVSTAHDYARFCQFLLNAGELDGVRLVSRKTIELMTANHLPPDTPIGADMARFEALAPSAAMGQGFGLGFAVRTDAGRNPLPGSVGDYFWGGAYGTYFWVDPKENMYVVLMMQSPQARLPYRFLLRQMVYQALIR